MGGGRCHGGGCHKFDEWVPLTTPLIFVELRSEEGAKRYGGACQARAGEGSKNYWNAIGLVRGLGPGDGLRGGNGNSRGKGGGPKK